MAESKRKRVLIITYYWPPSGGPGVQRWLKTVKYLREYGWEPIVFTPENPEVPVYDNSLLNDIDSDIKIIKRPIWEPYLYYKKLLGLNRNDKINAGFLTEKEKPGLLENFSVWIRGNLFIPDARKFWIKPSVRFLLKFLQNNQVDAIVTTGPPHSMHLIALEIRERLQIPWLADFRDPWTGIDFYGDLRLSSFADKRHHMLEKKVLMKADAVTVISQGMSETFEHIFEKKYHVVTNGFDPSDIQPIELDQQDKKFSIAHIGSLSPSRNPVSLWKALAELIKMDLTFASFLEIKLVGKVDYSVINSIEQEGLTKYLKKVEYVPHEQVIGEMQKSHVLLLLINQSPGSKGILTGKLFEYLAVKRPIICIGPVAGDASRILLDVGLEGSYGFEDVEGLKIYISSLFRSFQNGDKLNLDSSLEQFTRKELTGRIAHILNEISINK